jgi:CBS domain containing-hemolysin-like protein
MNDWYIVFITLAFSAFFSGMEIAFISSNKLRIELDRNKGLISGKILAYFLKYPSKILGTLLLGNNVALVIFGLSMSKLLNPVITEMIHPAYQSESLILTLKTIVSTLIILITAEFIPKALFRLKPNTTLRFFAVPINVIYWIFYPFIQFTVGISEYLIHKLLRIEMVRDEYVFTPVDLDNYIREFSPDKKEVKEVHQEIQMLQNAIEFKSVKLRECMVPRTEITALPEDESLEVLQETFIESGHSKILIYRETIDNIIGFVHTSSMFTHPRDIKSIVMPLPIFPETILADNVLNTFMKEHKTLAVVVDEFGGTSGIVTLEDIIEEIFGEIEDEYDTEELVEEQRGDHEYLLSARHEIDYLNEKYPLELPVSEEYETLGGLIIQIHESIPETGEEISYGTFRFIIKDASESRIELVHLYRLPDN